MHFRSPPELCANRDTQPKCAFSENLLQPGASLQKAALLPCGSCSLVETLSVRGAEPSWGTQRGCNSTKAPGLCLHPVPSRYTHAVLVLCGGFCGRLSQQPKSSATHKSARVMSARLPLSAKCVVSEEPSDGSDRPSSRRAVLTSTHCVSISCPVLLALPFAYRAAGVISPRFLGQPLAA